MNKNTQLQIAKQTQRGLDITHFVKEAHEISELAKTFFSV
jgi:phosphoribulokinase